MEDQPQYKTCSKCKLEKPITEFLTAKNTCKTCRTAHSKEWRANNKEHVKEQKHKWYVENKQHVIEKSNKWHQDNKEHKAALMKEWNQNNKERRDATVKRWGEKNPERKAELHREYEFSRKQTDPIFKLKCNIRNLIYSSFARRGCKKQLKSEAILKMPLNDFASYLEETFFKRYNRHYDPAVDKVHIDHIIPLATALTEDDVIKLCHYTNLQLLLAKDNLAKGDKVLDSNRV